MDSFYKIFILTSIFNLAFLYSYSQNNNDYEIKVNKELWKTNPINPSKYFDDKYLNDGNLYIHFQYKFFDDTATLKVNGEIYGIYNLKMEWTLSVAEIVKIQDFDKIKSIGISINGGKEAFMEIEKWNQVNVQLYKDTLFVGMRKHVYYYE